MSTTSSTPSCFSDDSSLYTDSDDFGFSSSRPEKNHDTYICDRDGYLCVQLPPRPCSPFHPQPYYTSNRGLGPYPHDFMNKGHPIVMVTGPTPPVSEADSEGCHITACPICRHPQESGDSDYAQSFLSIDFTESTDADSNWYFQSSVPEQHQLAHASEASHSEDTGSDTDSWESIGYYSDYDLEACKKMEHINMMIRGWFDKCEKDGAAAYKDTLNWAIGYEDIYDLDYDSDSTDSDEHSEYEMEIVSHEDVIMAEYDDDEDWSQPLEREIKSQMELEAILDAEEDQNDEEEEEEDENEQEMNRFHKWVSERQMAGRQGLNDDDDDELLEGWIRVKRRKMMEFEMGRVGSRARLNETFS